MAKEAWESLVAYKMVWLKLFFLMTMPIVTQFLAITQTVDMDVKWAQMGTFSRWGFFLGLVVPGVSAFLGMFDDSSHKAKTDLANKRSQTDFLKRSDTGP